MGQRHQVFLIARVVSHGSPQGEARYRCVGAFHHQWCYGRLPLRAARRLITLVKNEDNAEIIREELRAIQGKYGRPRTAPGMPRVPCPYTTFLMASSWSIDLENPAEPYASGVSFQNGALNPNMDSFGGANNDGITVIDITDPTKPAHCFVVNPRRGPISAADYVRTYYPIPKATRLQKHEDLRLEEEDVLDSIAALKDEPLVTVHMLAEAWPNEYKLPKATTPDATKSDDDPENAESTSNPIPKLADLAIAPAFERGLELNDTSVLEGLVWMPGKADVIAATLRAQSPFPDGGLALLSQVVGQGAETNKTVDLSSYHLSSDQIVTTATQFRDTEVLKLSSNPGVTIETLHKVLPSLPNLRRLVLLGTSITDDEIYDLATKHSILCPNIQAIIHPCFLRHNEHKYANAFAIITPSGAASLPWLTPDQVLQNVTDYLAPFTSDDFDAASSLLQSAMVPQAALGCEVRKAGQKWGSRSVPIFPQYSIRAFTGEGWFLALQWPPYGPSSANKYAFMQVHPDLFEKEDGDAAAKEGDDEARGTPVKEKEPLEHKICDLTSFLTELEKEGRPAPSLDVVDALTRVLDTLHRKKELTLMTGEEFSKFIQDTMMRSSFRY